MRPEYHHTYCGDEILSADNRSLKAGFGSFFPEAYNQNNPNFLKEVVVNMGNMGWVLAFVVSPPSKGLELPTGRVIQEGRSAMEVQQQDGGYTLMSVDESRWKDITTSTKKGTQS